MLAKQVLYCLRHTSSPVFALIIWEMGLGDYLPGLALNRDPPELSFPCS
jgi:hypothetical protein